MQAEAPSSDRAAAAAATAASGSWIIDSRAPRPSGAERPSTDRAQANDRVDVKGASAVSAGRACSGTSATSWNARRRSRTSDDRIALEDTHAIGANRQWIESQLSRVPRKPAVALRAAHSRCVRRSDGSQRLRQPSRRLREPDKSELARRQGVWPMKAMTPR